MSKIIYPATSPYANTQQTNWYLGPIKYRSIPAHSSDAMLVLDAKYDTRPDKLSDDLYGTPAYWWVFMVRNLDQIRDPIWDFRSGLVLFVPSSERLQKIIG